MPQRSLLSTICLAAATVWPAVFATARAAILSPYERALTTSSCGDLAHQGGLALAGHCAACWAGSMLLVAFGLALLVKTKAAPVRARVTRHVGPTTKL